MASSILPQLAFAASPVSYRMVCEGDIRFEYAGKTRQVSFKNATVDFYDVETRLPQNTLPEGAAYSPLTSENAKVDADLGEVALIGQNAREGSGVQLVVDPNGAEFIADYLASDRSASLLAVQSIGNRMICRKK